MEMIELNQSEMFALVAPDGTVQLTTIAPEFAQSVAIIEILADSNRSANFKQLCAVGFKILPIKITITQNGDEFDALERGFKQVGVDRKYERK